MLGDMNTATVPVLVVGAGPTGLALACELRRQGVECRILDAAEHRPAHQARALTMWDGALDVLARHGIAEQVKARGMPMTAACYWSGGRNIATVRLNRPGGVVSPLIITQPSVEEVMVDRLGELGLAVEWRTRLAQLTDRGSHVEVRLVGPDGPEELTASWVVGCDGAHSTVRELSGIEFGGSTYQRSFVLGDGTIDHPIEPGEAHYHLHPDGVLVLVPLPDGQLRVFADASAVGDQETAPTREDLQRLADERAPYPLKVGELQWSTRFLVHLRHAAGYRSGRCLVAGDAAHVHSPAGGQGINTGIQDAANLAWKLALVERGCESSERLLDSYQAERQPVAADVMRASHRQTKLWTVRSPLRRRFRDGLLGGLARSGVLERKLVPPMAQYDLDYRRSPITGPRGGRRALRRGLPEAELVAVAGERRVALAELLQAPEHVLLVFVGAGAREQVQAVLVAVAPLAGRLTPYVLLGQDADASVAPAAVAYRLPAGYAPQAELAGSRLVLVRPDGYVAAATETYQVEELVRPLQPTVTSAAPRR
jgi:2-polyprenyl-6-methoxyphenol hydroxylase-like FAD-dependent oxidoreductase